MNSRNQRILRAVYFECSRPYGPKYAAAHNQPYHGTECHIGTTLYGSKYQTDAIIRAHNKEYHT